jgi:D-tyrosyl-tRNA(Tyr) deacylase
MRAVIQRVSQAKVEIEGKVVGKTEGGLLVYLSVGKDDSEKDAQFIAEKITALRIFADKEGKMNLSIREVGGKILIVSNFTLHGNCRKGRRPGFDDCAGPEPAQRLYERVIELTRQQGIEVQTGVFAADMKVESVNDGPVTFILDSR